jgi:hypothetical protein
MKSTSEISWGSHVHSSNSQKLILEDLREKMLAYIYIYIDIYIYTGELR